MIVVDMESSGLDPIRDSLLSVGAVEFENPANQFYGECRIWDGAHFDRESLKINGFSEEEIVSQHKKSEAELVKEFMDWALACKEDTFAGQNPSSDRDFLREAAKRAHLNWPFAYRVVDLHSVVYFHMLVTGLKPPVLNKHSALNLDAILKYVGLPEEPKPHNGLVDAQIEAESFSRLMFGKHLLAAYKSYPIPKELLK